MKRCISGLFASVVVAGIVAVASARSFAAGENVRPTAELELRANADFNRGQYNSALPILKGLAETSKDDPGKLGALQEKIRVCEKALAAAKANPVAAPAAPAMSAESRRPHPAFKPGEVLELSIKELGNFEYDQEHGGNIPADVRQLNGAKIRLRGYMIPMDQAENVTQFALVPSLFSCCIGGPPQIQHTIVANCPRGKAVGYSPDEIMVEGKLAVEEKKDDGYIISIFSLEISSVKAAPK